MTVVQDYAAAKSRADVEAALALCTEEFTLETVPFQLTARGKDEARIALGAFFVAFPDYEVTLDGLIEADGEVAAWGVVRATMWGDLLGQKATGRPFELPMSCVFKLDGGRLASESFYFDLNQMCEQLGLSTEAVAADLRQARRALETNRLKEAA
jgi:steroid delta-isomerase-like uncharacterized protein